MMKARWMKLSELPDRGKSIKRLLIDVCLMDAIDVGMADYHLLPKLEPSVSEAFLMRMGYRIRLVVEESGRGSSDLPVWPFDLKWWLGRAEKKK